MGKRAPLKCNALNGGDRGNTEIIQRVWHSRLTNCFGKKYMMFLAAGFLVTAMISHLVLLATTSKFIKHSHTDISKLSAL